MTKINYFEIENADIAVLTKYFADKFRARNERFFNRIQWSPSLIKPKNKVDAETVYIKNEKNSDNIYADFVIQIALKYLNYYRYTTADLNYKNYYIELFKYECIGAPNTLELFDMHEDDYAVMDYKVNTIIFYLTKSDTLEGGNLAIEIDKVRNVLPIKSGMGLAFEGNLQHQPEPCSGMGVRECIVVHLARDTIPRSNGVPLKLVNGEIATELSVKKDKYIQSPQIELQPM
jgi:hypothetical protein